MTGDDRDEITRRAVLIGSAAAGVATLVPSTAAEAAESASPEGSTTATGLVYQLADDARQGVPGVLVSNGRDVAVTDGDGRYTLPVTDEAVLFVIKPAGFMTPVDPATMLPRFSTSPRARRPALG